MVIICGSKGFPVHRFMMAATSEAFHRLLTASQCRDLTRSSSENSMVSVAWDALLIASVWIWPRSTGPLSTMIKSLNARSNNYSALFMAIRDSDVSGSFPKPYFKTCSFFNRSLSCVNKVYFIFTGEQYGRGYDW